MRLTACCGDPKPFGVESSSACRRWEPGKIPFSKVAGVVPLERYLSKSGASAGILLFRSAVSAVSEFGGRFLNMKFY